MREQSQNALKDDGRGKRYLLGPLYLQIGDLEGALRSYEWYETNFPDDSGEPFHYLCWALALYKAEDLKSAKKKLLETMFQNLYLLAHLLGLDCPPGDLEHSTSFEDPEYVEELPQELAELWDAEALAWARSTYFDLDSQAVLHRYISIKRQLKNTPVGDERSRLLFEMRQIRPPDQAFRQSSPARSGEAHSVDTPSRCDSIIPHHGKSRKV